MALLHGLGGDSTHFSGIFASPVADGRGLISVDMLGAGESARLSPGTPYTFELQARAIGELMQSLAIKRIGLALHSMAAGLLPQLSALSNGSRLQVDAVYLIEGNLVAEDANWSGELAAMSEDDFPSYWRTLTRTARVVLARQLAGSHDRAQIVEWAASFARWDTRAIRETAAELHSLTVSGEIAVAFRRFNGRKVYLRGEDGRSWSGRAFLRETDSQYVGVPDAGHYVMLDAPDTVAAAL